VKYHCNHVEMLYERLKPIYDANDRRYSRMQMYERISLILNYPSDQQSQDCFSHIDKPCTKHVAVMLLPLPLLVLSLHAISKE